MPSPPDVILVLSPRMARMVKFAVRVLSNEAEFLDFDDNGQFASLDEAEDAAAALMREIDEQLSRDRALAQAVGTADDIAARQRGDSDVARVAAKMAKAARGAVEPDFGHISEDQSSEEIARQVEEADPDRQPEYDDPRGPGDGLGA